MFILFFIIFIIIILFTFYFKQIQENFNVSISYNNYCNPKNNSYKNNTTNEDDLTADEEYFSSFPISTPQPLLSSTSIRNCNPNEGTQCPPPTSGNPTYFCPSTGGCQTSTPFPDCANQCVQDYSPPKPLQTCSEEDMESCNVCQYSEEENLSYCCRDSKPAGCNYTGEIPGCKNQCILPQKPKLKSKRNFAFKNSCSQPVCVGYIGSSQSNGGQFNGGFQLQPGQQLNKTFPGDWINGRLWPRTGCDSNCTNCQTGDCGNEQCTISGQNPASLFEISMDKNVGYDTYDGSLVDGYNIPMSVTPTGGTNVPGQAAQYNCTPNSCPSSQLNFQNCPPELQKTINGKVVGCYSLCHALEDNNLNKPGGIIDKRCKSGDISNCKNGVSDLLKNKDLYCCDCGKPKDGCPTSQLPKDSQGNPINGCAIEGTQKESVDTIKKCCNYGCSPFALPGNQLPSDQSPVCSTENWPKPSGFCKTNNIPSTNCTYPDLFKNQCPNFYSWPFDDLKSTYQCKNADYNVEFCPK